VGAQLDAEFNFRGFLLRKGWFSPINVPFLGAKGTFPTMIVGERIVGGWFDDNFTAHGFLGGRVPRFLQRELWGRPFFQIFRAEAWSQRPTP